MKYLLDTHILFWSMSDENRLPKDVLDILNDPKNEIYFSSASVWEIVIKHQKHPGNMPIDGQEFMEGCIQSDFIPLPIENRHVLTVGTLVRDPAAPPHNDPFDRVLLSQAKTEGMTFITNDSLIPGYNESCVLKI